MRGHVGHLEQGNSTPRMANKKTHSGWSGLVAPLSGITCILSRSILLQLILSRCFLDHLILFLDGRLHRCNQFSFRRRLGRRCRLFLFRSFLFLRFENRFAFRNEGYHALLLLFPEIFLASNRDRNVIVAVFTGFKDQFIADGAVESTYDQQLTVFANSVSSQDSPFTCTLAYGKLNRCVPRLERYPDPPGPSPGPKTKETEPSGP